MFKPITVRGLEIGTGAPKIIVPIVAATKEGILDKARSLKDYRYDMVEWRVDFYDDALDIPKVLEVLAGLRGLLTVPLLFTFRTKKEGGEKHISLAEYTALNKAVAESGNADFVDVEIFSGDDVVRENIANCHAAGVRVVGSSHEFARTPSQADMVYRLRKMQDMDADIPKIAVMPNSTQDVLALLAATAEMHEFYADRPIMTMSMSPKGVLSRLAGECFGSALTFGAVGQVSAPGQIPVEKLAQTLEVLHNAL